MSTLLVDSPPAAPGAEPAREAGSGAPGEPASTRDQTCAGCGAGMALSQDWCLQCGADAGSSGGSPGWRPAATILAATALLALAAAAAGYAALGKSPHRPRVVTATVAQAQPPVAAAPVAPLTPARPLTPATPAPSTVKPLLPSGASIKPPKIPSAVATPGISTPAKPSTPIKVSAAPAQPSTEGSEGGGESEPATILLDTNAASTYNPYNYPASGFGDPSLTIDGDTSTAWTAQVQPTLAPKMAEGVLIDLKAGRRVAAVELTTSSPGLTVQFYGANGHSAPTSITDPAWITLSHSQVAAKKRTRIALRDSTKSFRFLTLWISRAPQADVGTATAPGHVSVDEIELFPAG